MFFTLILAFFFLKETITPQKVFGITLVFFGITILVLPFKARSKQKNNLQNNPTNITKGVLLTSVTAFFLSITYIVDKYATKFFNPEVYAFLVYFVPTLFLMPFALMNKKDISSLLKHKRKVISSSFLGALYYYLLLNAFRLLDASIVIPTLELSSVISVIGGIIFLRERTRILQKLLATLLVIIGVLTNAGFLF